MFFSHFISFIKNSFSFLNNERPLTGNSIIKIGFEALQIECLVGIHAHERENKQLLIVDLIVEVNLKNFLNTHDLSDTLDYVQLADMCTRLAKTHHYLLIESYALAILDECTTHFGALAARVIIRKPAAIADAKCAFVEMEIKDKSCGH